MSRRTPPAEARARRAAEDDPAVVFEAALRFLEPRARAVGEVRRRLAQAGYRAELIDGAVARLLELGMLDDEAFARHWVASRDRAHPRGERALRHELLAKGIAPDVVARVLAERDEAADDTVEDGMAKAENTADEAAAARLLERKGASLARIADPRVRRQRAYALLARSGFDSEIAGRLAASLAGSDDGADMADEGPGSRPS